MSDGYYDPSEVDLRDVQHERRIHELTSALHDTLEREATFALEVAKLKRAFYKTSHGVEQILGKALHYPAFVDDQKNFPGATEADGVCVGEHVPESIAEAAANRIVLLESQVTDLESQRDLALEEITGLRAALHDAESAYSQLSASQERERILREVVVEVKETSASALQTTYQTRFNKYFLHFIQLTADVLEKVKEVKG